MLHVMQNGEVAEMELLQAQVQQLVAAYSAIMSSCVNQTL